MGQSYRSALALSISDRHTGPTIHRQITFASWT